MKLFTFAATALFATVAYAAQASVKARSSEVCCTFIGAVGSFSQCFPTDGSIQPISILASFAAPTHRILTFERTGNPLSISRIQCGGFFICTFTGIDGSVTVIVRPTTTDVGPPQTLESGSCVVPT